MKYHLCSLRFIGILVLQFGLFVTAKAQEPVYSVAPDHYIVPSGEGLTSTLLADQEALSITADGLEKSVVIPLDRFAVEPNTAYAAQYNLLAQNLSESANVYLLIREHRGENERPIQPYHVESSRLRELKAESEATWKPRRVTFTTGPETTFLSGSIVFAQVKGTLLLSPFTLWEQTALDAQADKEAEKRREEAQAAYDQKMSEIHAQAAKRTPLLPRPLVFSRAQIKYGLGRNYYHDWNDRPLLTSRDYRLPSTYTAPLESYRRTLEEMTNHYRIDGLAFFPQTSNRMKTFQEHREAEVPGAGLLMEIFAPDTPGVSAASSASESVLTSRVVNAVKLALETPAAARVHGKLLITSYNAQSASPEQWKRFLDRLREEVGDTFVFLPALANLQPTHNHYYLKGEPAPVAEIEKLENFLRSYLDVCDGIYFNYPPALYKKDHSFDNDYYREVLIPVMKSVLSEPPYRKKYLGLSAYRSHVNPTGANNLYQNGTRTMRDSLGTAIAANPDVIILPEWDEQNENTSWRPTIYGARSSARIVRYYMSQIRGDEPSPMPGDDTSLPNLTLSSRKIAVLGEKIVYELLNIPDGAQGRYRVQLSLEDEHGDLVKRFDAITFQADTLQEQRFALASESLSQVRALNPVLSIEGYKGQDLVIDEGLHAVQLRATWNWDFLDINQPLRDILRPVEASLQWETPTTLGGPLILSGEITSPENLNTIEVLGDDDEAFAVDRDNEFFRGDSERELVLIDYRSLLNLAEPMAGEISLKNATAIWFNNGNRLEPENTNSDGKGERIDLTTPVSFHKRWLYLAIPKTEIAKGELHFDTNVAKFSLPLRELFEKKMIAHAFEGGLNITLRPYRRQIDMPVPFNDKSTSFQVPIWPELASEQYHLRLTTTEGKVYRSRPLMLPAKPSEETSLRVYSEDQERGVDLLIKKDRIPDLKYDFDPTRGAVLLTDAGQPFWGSLGGFDSSTTGRGHINGIGHTKHDAFPDTVKRSDPQWVKEEGIQHLEFNGKSTYIALPRETLPFKGAFTMSFEVKPDANETQTLLVNGTVGRQTGLLLRLRDGKLQATLPDTDWKTISLNSNLSVPAGQWSQITVQRDFETLTLSVDGHSESVDSTFPTRNIGYLIFGGYGDSWFAGKMRKLRIVHNVTSP